jgi:alanine dehydrogenase
MALLLTLEDVEQAVKIEEIVEAMDQVYADHGRQEAVDRPRSHAYTTIPGTDYLYQFKSMDGGAPRFNTYAIRMSSDVIHEYEEFGRLRQDKIPVDNGKYMGLVLLFEISSGRLLAIIQDSALSRMRVGATSAIAAKYLSRPNAARVGLIGTGWQAETQLTALACIRQLESVTVYSPNPTNRSKFADRMSERLGISVIAVDNPKPCVDDKDIVVASTNSLEPVFDGNWLQPGQHVNSLIAWELDDVTLERSDVICARALQPSNYYAIGERRTKEFERNRKFPPEWQQKLISLGDVVLGCGGRISEDQITLFGGTGTGGSSGMGIQFAAAGAVAYKRAKELGVGRDLPDDWFLESMHP